MKIMKRMAVFLATLVIGLTLAIAGRSVEPVAVTPEQAAFFENNVRPVLAEQCFRCHSQEAKKKGKLKGGLYLDSLAGMLKGGDSGPAIVPAKPDDSLLVKGIRYTDNELEMPPKQKLSADDIATLTEWVAMGAPWPDFDPEAVAASEDEEPYDWEKFRTSHWAFRPVSKSAAPKVKDPSWPKGAIDHYVLAGLEARGIKPNAPATKRHLIRRAYLDLIGLTPSTDQVQSFLQDDRADAFARVIDELLASPHYGERWGRYWLDVARYSDGFGGFGDGAALPNAWRFRDWVVQALNADLPYNEFVTAQIAGDLLEEKADPVGTGFFAVGPTYKGDGGDAEATAQARAETLSDRVDTFSRAFLGLTVACARCHDHKFDPITAKDYYAIAGIFNNSKLRVHPLVSKAEVEAYNQAQAEIKTKDQAVKEWENHRKEVAMREGMRQVEDHLVTLFRFYRQRLQPEGQKDLAAYASQHKCDTEYMKRWDQKLRDARFKGKFKELDIWYDLKPAADKTKATEAQIVESARAFKTRIEGILNPLEEKEKVWREARANGDLKKGRPKPEKQGEALLKELRQHIYPVNLDRILADSGRAEWDRMKAEREALKKNAPARFAEAHGIGESGSGDMHVALRGDLRKKGELAPRRFLQIIAGEEAPVFKKGSGRMELAQAVIDPANPLTSRVMVNRIWQGHFGAALVRTPSNFGSLGEKPDLPKLLDYLAARFIEHGWSMKKLHREIMLSATWQMSSAFDQEKFNRDGDNRSIWRMNPRKLDVESWRDNLLGVTGELDETLGGAPAKEILGSTRRTLYASISRNGDRFQSDDFLRLFDFPDPRATSPQRSVSTVPQQYLFMMNSPFMQARAKALAAQLSKLENNEQRVRSAYERLYARVVEPAELSAGLAFLGEAPDKQWPAYAQVLLSAHEFMQIQ